MNIVCSFSKVYMKHFLVMSKSLIQNTDVNINFYIFHKELNNEDIKKIKDEYFDEEHVNFEFHKIDMKAIKRFPLTFDYLTLETYSRLIAPSILPNNVKKAIFIDCDIVIMDDISKLNNIDLNNYIIGAVSDLNLNIGRNIGINDPLDYLNAGVLLINVEKWKNTDFTSELLNYGTSNINNLEYVDQDIINGVLKGNWFKLPLKWNVTQNCWSFKEKLKEVVPIYELESALAKPSIVHYTTAIKPWHIFNTHVLKSNYFYYLNLLKDRNKYLLELDPLRGKQLFLFGTGQTSTAYISKIKNLNMNIEGYFDNNNKLWESNFQGKTIFEPKLDNLNDKIIIIASQFHDQITNQLLGMGLKQNYDFFDNMESFLSYCSKIN